MAKTYAWFVLAFGALAGGCAEKQAEDPGQIMREEAMLPPSDVSFDDPVHTVRVAEDENGGLLVQAPPGSRVIRPAGSPYPAEVEVLLPPPNEGGPLRVTKSLGYVGDGKLGQYRPAYGASYNVAPPHESSGWRYMGRYRVFR